MVPFARGGALEAAVCIADIGADEIAERAVIAQRRIITAAGRIVAAGAIGFTRTEIVAGPRAVLARRVHQIPLYSADRRGFVPNGMRNARAEFDAVVAASVTHDNRVVAPLAGERVKRSRRILVRRVALADLDRTRVRRGEPYPGIAAEQGAVDLVAEIAVRLLIAGRCRNIDAGFQLIDEVHAIHAGDFLESPDAEIRQVG